MTKKKRNMGLGLGTIIKVGSTSPTGRRRGRSRRTTRKFLVEAVLLCMVKRGSGWKGLALTDCLTFVRFVSACSTV